MQRFIKLTYGPHWSAIVNPNHIIMVEKHESGTKVQMTHHENAYAADQSMEEIMEMING